MTPASSSWRSRTPEVIRIGLDAMGGDHAPSAEVDGAALALTELPPTFLIQFVGRPADIEKALAEHRDIPRARIEVVDAPEVVGMGEKPRQALRSKPKSPIAIGLTLQKNAKSDAFRSAGTTRAL